jgi:prepilin-type N-terminal cleavage/methylation domain-containing protein
MMRRIGQQRGLTLIEVLAALAIGAVLLVGLSGLVEQSLDDMKGQQAAYYQAQVVDAARRYLDTNAGAVATQTPTATTVLAITLAELRAGKFLPDGFADTNPYRQGACVLVRRPDPVNYAGQFDALIVGTGGDKIGDKDLAAVAMLAGSGGGYIAATAPGVARGASWQMTTTQFRGVTCAGSAAPALQGTVADAGHLVSSLFHDGAAQQAADFVYRNRIPGRPEANRMNTPLRFGADALVVGGTPCLNEGANEAALAVDAATRVLLTCGLDGKWSLPPTWKDPVGSHGALLALAENKVGDVRMVTDLSRAFTYSAAGWLALAVDQDGNFDVPNSSSAGQLLARQEVRSRGTIHAVGHMSTERDLHVGQDAFVERDTKVKHNLVADGVQALGWMQAPAVHITDVYPLGHKCHYEIVDPFDGKVVIAYPHGTIVTDADMRPLICGLDNTFKYTDGPPKTE